MKLVRANGNSVEYAVEDSDKDMGQAEGAGEALAAAAAARQGPGIDATMRA